MTISPECMDWESGVLALSPLPSREREGPTPEAWEGEGAVAAVLMLLTAPSPSHCCAMGPFLSRKGRGAGERLRRAAQHLRLLQVHRNELRYAALGHRDAEQPVHAGHGQPVMGDDEEARLRALADLLDEAAEAVDIGVVEGGVDLVQHADRRRVGEEHGKEQRQPGQGLLAAREQRHHLQPLARRARHDLEAGLERVSLRVAVLALVEREKGAAAAEEPHEELAEMVVDLRES